MSLVSLTFSCLSCLCLCSVLFLVVPHPCLDLGLGFGLVFLAFSRLVSFSYLIFWACFVLCLVSFFDVLGGGSLRLSCFAVLFVFVLMSCVVPLLFCILFIDVTSLVCLLSPPYIGPPATTFDGRAQEDEQLFTFFFSLQRFAKKKTRETPLLE